MIKWLVQKIKDILPFEIVRKEEPKLDKNITNQKEKIKEDVIFDDYLENLEFDYVARANLIKSKTKQEDELAGIIKPNKDYACSECGCNDVQLIHCEKCDALVCADCMIDTVDGKTLCNKCYDEDVDPFIVV